MTSLQDVLNAEVDLPALARGGWHWWTGELAAMAPPAWRARLGGRPRVLAEPAAPGVWRYWRDGEPVDRAPERGGAPEPVGLLLPPDAVLEQPTPTPRMAAADVRRMLAFDLERLSPLAPELVHFDAEIVERDIGEGRQQVLMGIVPRSVVDALLDAAERDGLVPAAVGLRVDDAGATSIRYDFLPAARPGARAGRRAMRYWWGAVAALFVLNLAVLVARDMAQTARLQAMVDAKAPMVNAALALRRRVEGEERRRADLIARGQRGEPLRVLDAATTALPEGVWVRRLEWNGQTLHLAGYRKTGLDVAAALRAGGVFANPRTQAPEGGAGPAEAPFDIAVDVRPEGRR